MTAGQDTDVEHTDVAAILADKSNNVQAPTFGAGHTGPRPVGRGVRWARTHPPISKTQKILILYITHPALRN